MVGELVSPLDLIIGPVQMLNFWRPGQEAFLSAPTKVMLLPPMFSLPVLKIQNFYVGHCHPGQLLDPIQIVTTQLQQSQAGEVGDFPYQC
jgi:hypothetical protein